MTNRTHPLRLALTALCMLGLTLPVAAQDNTLMYSVSTYKCDRSMLPDIVDMMQERALPVAQALVDEGKLMTWGRGVHQWGDEYNLLTWSAAPTMEALLDARQETIDRMQEANDDSEAMGATFMEACPTHRDYFYTREAGTTSGLDASTTDDPNTLTVSFYQCDYTKIDEIVAWEKETMQPAAQALVDAGTLGGRSLFTHAWGDEWNVLVSQVGNDLPEVLDSLDELAEATGTRPMQDEPTPLTTHCSEHKDNIYWMMMTTTPPSE